MTRSPTLMGLGAVGRCLRRGRRRVGAGGVGEDGGAELLGELAANAGHAQGGVAGDLLGDGLVVDGLDDLVELGVEVFEEVAELELRARGCAAFCSARPSVSRRVRSAATSSRRRLRETRSAVAAESWSWS